MWGFNLNLASIIVAFLAFYLYFAVSFDFSSLYGQFCNFFLDIEVVLKHFPWFLSGTIAWLIFSRIVLSKAIVTRRFRTYNKKSMGY